MQVLSIEEVDMVSGAWDDQTSWGVAIGAGVGFVGVAVGALALSPFIAGAAAVGALGAAGTAIYYAW